MSMELWVVLDRTMLPSRKEWQDGLEHAGLDVAFAAGFQPEAASGFQPMAFRGRSTGCEFCLDDVDESSLPEHLRARARDLGTVAVFRFGGDIDELAVALAASSTLALASGGLYFDPQEGSVLDGSAAMAFAQRQLEGL